MNKIICLILLGQIAFAGASFDYRIQFGERTTQYKLSNSDKPALLKVVSGSPDRTIEVNEDNRNFLMEQVKELAKLKSTDTKVCTQKLMKMSFEVAGKLETRAGCIGAINPVSQKLTALANLLGYL